MKTIYLLALASSAIGAGFAIGFVEDTFLNKASAVADNKAITQVEKEYIISDLFGVKLGSKVDNYKLTSKPRIIDIAPAGNWQVEISPPKRNTNFTKYRVEYNPINKEIYQIVGQMKIDRGSCENWTSEFTHIFNKKYEPHKMSLTESRESGAIFVKNENEYRELQIICMGQKYEIWIYDKTAAYKHFRENKDIQKTDTTGF